LFTHVEIGQPRRVASVLPNARDAERGVIDARSATV
jgi:hypothetical protein